MDRGDIFHDGLLGYWVLHEKPNGRKLYLVPLEQVYEAPPKTGCSCWHDPKTWNLENVQVICNLYVEPEFAANLIGDGTSFKEKMLHALKNPPKHIERVV